MVIDIEQQTYVMLPLDKIVSKFPVRRLSELGITKIVESMRWAGFLENYPLTVMVFSDGTYLLIDGNHRYEAAKRLGIQFAPCILKAPLPEHERYHLAMQANNAAETVVVSTLVTYAEFIWARLAEVDENDPEPDLEKKRKKYTQSDVGQMLGWSRGQISQYALLDKIDKQAWEIIATTFDHSVADSHQDVGAKNATVVAPFTERFLRDSEIIFLLHKQQIELVQDLATGKIEKNTFTKLAKIYKTRNEIKKYISEQLNGLEKHYITKCNDAIDNGAYDSEWQSNKEHKEHPKLDKLIQSIRDEWEQKSSYRLIFGDFYEEVKKIGDGCIDLVLSDPPYNIARENEFEYEGRSNVSQDFGEWDKYTHLDFISLFDVWAREWFRILREQGSGYVFTSDSYISHLRTALEDAGLHVKATVIWHKTNPGTQPVKTNFKSSVEYILFFTKGKGGHTFNWQGENEMQNFIETPICAGKERLVNSRGETLHPTQKPERIIEHFMKISSNQGDTVFDGFMGVGTSGKVAKDKRRKFIGIEQDKAFFDAATRRLADGQ